MTAKGYKTPQWFNSIKPGSHGSTPAQERLWRVISEHVRKRDFEAYGGKCVSCPYRFSNWKEAQAGHWLPFSLCNAWYKYDYAHNLAAQCAGCNRSLHRSGAHVGHAMGEELKRRHGDDVLDRIMADNLSYRGQKMEAWEIVKVVEALRPDLVIPT